MWGVPEKNHNEGCPLELKNRSEDLTQQQFSARTACARPWICPHYGQKRIRKPVWPLSFVFCFFLSSSSIPLIASHPFSSDFLLSSGTCCSVCVEKVVFPELPLLCTPLLPNLPSAFLWWGLSRGLHVISDSLQCGELLREWGSGCVLANYLYLCMIEGLLQGRAYH